MSLEEMFEGYPEALKCFTDNIREDFSIEDDEKINMELFYKFCNE